VSRPSHTIVGDPVKVDYPSDFERGAIRIPLNVLRGGLENVQNMTYFCVSQSAIILKISVSCR
jgi:hypothetical protein